MNVLHVNNVDLPGRRFNGYDLIDELAQRGVECAQAVISKQSKNKKVFSLPTGPAEQDFQYALNNVEYRHSMSNILFPWGRVLAGTKQFRAADVVHYHLIHNQMVSLMDLPMLLRLKPSIWTFHDPWPLTGHCIYPRECTGWMEGCEPCPHLDWAFPMRDDCAGRMWRVKQRVYTETEIDVVVASDFMLNMVRRSPLTSHLDRIHLVPFGIRMDSYLPDAARPASRKRLGIPQDDLVLLFRSTPSAVKGMSYIIQALKMRPPERPVTLLTVDKRHLLKELSSAYNVVELGWVDDASLYPHIYSACDVFLMPSTAEAFGLMALEAMAAGRPVICFDGTSVPSVTHAPQCGLAVPMSDATALRRSIDLLASHPEEAQRRGQLGRSIASTVYSHDRYLDSLVTLYEDVWARFQAGVHGAI